MQSRDPAPPDDNRIPLGAAGPKQPVRSERAYFDAPVCRNCAAPLDTPYCGQCGQKKAERFTWRDAWNETWERVRLFELLQASTLWRLVRMPGYVAREYVLGRRKAHMHPLKLLLFLVVLLVLMLNANSYFTHFSYSRREDETVMRMAALIQSYSNWSFTLSIFAIFSGSWLVFRKRLGYNALEHAVLAVYCQILLLSANLVALLPTLFWNSPDFISAYKIGMSRWMYVVKLLVVGLAFRQFFLLDLPREALRLAAALAVYAIVSWALLRLFAFLILKVALYQVS